MRIVKFSALYIICVCVLLLNGCVGEQEYKDLKVRNNTQRKRIAELDSETQAMKLKLDQAKRQLEAAQNASVIDIDALKQTVTALEDELAKKKALVASMQQQLIYGGVALPVELSTLLEDFAQGRDMVIYDSDRGVIRFKSDLLFEPGSDTVVSAAIKAVQSLCQILNSDQGKKFDVIVAGHTDDIRIGKPQTRAKHPTNWHLSANRAISVLKVMAQNKIASERMSVRGFSEFRPIEPNKANKKGNPKNRRVEIYIVAKGV